MIDRFPINDKVEKTTLLQKLYRITIIEKFQNPIGIAFFGLAAVFFALVVAKLGMVMGALMLGAIVALPIVYGTVAHPKFGILVLLTASYYIMLLIKLDFTTFPLGTSIDVIEMLLIIGFFVRQKFDKNYAVFKNPISYLILIWVAYNLLEVANPWASSRLAWLYTVRTVAFVTLMYFIFQYNINTVKFIRIIIVMWLIYSVVGALYGIWQEIFGYAHFEQAVMDADPERAGLYFIEGHWRKFSIYNDPVVFAYNMVLSNLLCIGLAWGTKKTWKKAILGFCALLFFVSMIFSGTRGAFVLIPAGVVLYFVLNFNKKIMVVSIVGAIGFLMLIVVPTSNPNIHRFQTAFKPSNDASYRLRQQNQAFIKPYIHTHPMGGGLGSVGVWGQRFSPDSMLAHFPPDSGFVRVAVEMGWVGLILFCTLLFVILKTGINNYFLIQNRELKAYCLAMTIMIFAISIGNYPQEALVQYPTTVFFYLMVAILNKCPELDKQLQAKQALQQPAQLLA